MTAQPSLPLPFRLILGSPRSFRGDADCHLPVSVSQPAVVESSLPLRINQNATGPAPDFRRCQISLANALRSLAGVARIIATASPTGIASFSPFILVTAVSHCASVFAPPLDGLYWMVSRPIPARLIAFPHRTLHARQVQNRFAPLESSSSPLMWPTSTLRRDPHKQHTCSPGGGHAVAR